MDMDSRMKKEKKVSMTAPAKSRRRRELERLSNFDMTSPNNGKYPSIEQRNQAITKKLEILRTRV